MPTNKNAVTRFKYLDEMLSDRHHYYDIHDLTDGVNKKLIEEDGEGVSERCIQKDLLYIEEGPFKAPIYREKRGGKNIIYYDDRSFSIFKKELTDDEKNLLNEVLNTIGQFDGLDNFEWLDGLRSKLNTVDHNRKIISFSTNPYLKNSTLLGALFTAISSKQVVKLHYRPFHAEVRDFLVYPYLLKQYNNRWFLIGGDVRDDFVGNYPLDRIEGFEVMYELPYKDSGEDLEDRYENIIGVTVKQDSKVEHIVCWASEKEYPYIETKPLHWSQRWVRGEQEQLLKEKYDMLEEGRFLSIDCMENYELIQLLVSYGAELIVLSPMNIREKVVNWAVGMSEKYKKI